MMGLGMGEIMVVLVLALMVFGPRKLPELGMSLGQAMNQFRKASDEFKRTWEQEVEHDKVRTDDKSTTSTNSIASNTDSGYSAESDYQYGYDTGYDGVTGNDALPAADTSASVDANVETPSVEKKAEPQWI